MCLPNTGKSSDWYRCRSQINQPANLARTTPLHAGYDWQDTVASNLEKASEALRKRVPVSL